MINVETINVGALPFLKLENRRQLPAVPAIYFAIGNEGDVLYIGKAECLAKRWAGHHRLLQLTHLGNVCIAWLEVDNIDDLLSIEDAAISHFSPCLNMTIIPHGDRVDDGNLLHIRIPENAKQTIKDRAALEGLTVSAYVRRLILMDVQKASPRKHAAA